MATFTAQDVARAGVTPTYNPTTASDKFPAGDGIFVHVKNTSAAATTPTFVTPGKVAELDLADSAQVSVPATSGDRMIGPFPSSLFAGSDGNVTVNWSASGAGVTFAVLKLF